MDETNAIRLPDPGVDPDAYRAELVAIVGNRDPLDVIAKTPTRVRELIEDRTPEQLDRRPREGEWSVTEIIGHLLDDEIVNSFRLRLTLTSDQTVYPGTDPERRAVLPKPPVDQLLTIWEGLHNFHLWLLRSIPRSEWDRIGVHAEQGPESIEIQVLKNAGHDLAHLNQIERCLAGH